MFALDIKLEDAIAELGESKDAFQWEVKPDDEVHEIKDLSRRQFEAKRAGTQINREILAFHNKIFSNPFFKWLFSKIESSASNQVVYFEPIQNILEAISEGTTFFVSGLETEKGILIVMSQKDERNFDPKTYVEENSGWFYRNDPSSPIQRGRGFQAMDQDRNTYISFERLDRNFLTIIHRPFDIQEQQKAKYEKIREADRKVEQVYLGIAKAVAFEFDEEFSEQFPDRSDETLEAVRKKVKAERPDLLPMMDWVIKSDSRFNDKRFSVYRNPDQLLKEYEINS